MSEESNQITDTHMSKKYNDVIYECMMNANRASIQVTSTPHFSLLVMYHSAVQTFFNNTFFLFESVRLFNNKEPLSKILFNLSEKIRNQINEMSLESVEQNEENYYDLFRDLSYSHQMIMYGLQARNMLVRMSEREVRGEESVDYWGQLKSFKKGAVLNDDEWRQKLK